MCCAAQEDPVAAIVLHASAADVALVVVDGKIVKRGATFAVGVAAYETFVGAPLSTVEPSATTLSWPQIAAQLLASRTRFLERERGLNINQADVRAGLLSGLGVNINELMGDPLAA